MSRAPGANEGYRIGPRGGEGNGAHSGLAPNGDPVRVILVGKTGLDQILRSDRAVELLRSKTALEAIGELSDPIDEFSPRASAVVLGPGMVEPARASAYADALRSLEPDVRILNIGAASMPGMDGHISPHADSHTIRRAVRPAHGSTAAPPQANGRAPISPPAASYAEPSPRPAPATPAYAATHIPLAPAADSFDRSLLHAVLGGKDAASAALAQIAERTGIAPQFLAAPAVPTGIDAQSSAPVIHAGRTLGHLIAPGMDPASLAQAANALAPWLLLAAQQEQLKKAAFTDELTGAWNRRYFLRFLSAAIDHARAPRHPVTLLYFDVDNFKSYNDAYGHAAGDEILTETVRLLNSVIRPTDRVCRIGGDEFAVIFHDPEGPRKPEAGGAPRTIAQTAARFQKQICEHRFPKLDKAPGTLTISGGIATFPWDGTTPQELLERADALALQSKRQGKNVITFGPGAERECRVDQT